MPLLTPALISRPALLIAALCFPIAAAAQSQPRSPSIVRLAPAAFPGLPRDVASALHSQGCRIPQISEAPARENIIHGAFTAAHVSEWAALCSIADTGRILIVRRERGGGARIVDSLERGGDLGCMQGTGNAQWGSSCRLQARPQGTIRRWSESVHRRIDHDAIEVVFVGKGAVAYYFANGRWHRFVTAD